MASNVRLAGEVRVRPATNGTGAFVAERNVTASHCLRALKASFSFGAGPLSLHSDNTAVRTSGDEFSSDKTSEDSEGHSHKSQASAGGGFFMRYHCRRKKRREGHRQIERKKTPKVLFRIHSSKFSRPDTLRSRLKETGIRNLRRPVACDSMFQKPFRPLPQRVRRESVWRKRRKWFRTRTHDTHSLTHAG